MSNPLSARLAAEYESAARTLPASAARSARRRAAIEALAASGLPSQRDENWKYANLRPLERLRFAPAAGRPLEAGTDLPAALPGFTRYVFVDGSYAPALSAQLGATAARILTLAQDEGAGAAARVDPAASADERFATLNAAFATDGATVHVPATAAGVEPVRLEVLFIANAEAEAGASYPRLELKLDPGARLSLIERHLSAGTAASFVDSAVSVELGRGAACEHYRLQELGGRAILFDTLTGVLAQDATYRLLGIHTGAQSARSTLALQLAGERAELALSIAALGDRQQVQDAYARIEHVAPRARTVQTFRGISAGRARVAFNGKIVVARQAQGTDSRQSLRGLLAGPEAEIDVRPQLEIYTDEVRCSHGATAGKLDDDMLFYLLSRGLDRDSAQRLLKWAFLEDVISQIAVPELRRQIEARMAGQLKDDALRELL